MEPISYLNIPFQDMAIFQYSIHIRFCIWNEDFQIEQLTINTESDKNLMQISNFLNDLKKYIWNNLIIHTLFDSEIN